jgi:hypothetical protein
MVKDWPPAVTVLERATELGLAGMERAMAPEPVPEAAPEIVIQEGSLETAVQAQAGEEALMATGTAETAAAGNERDDGEKVNEQEVPNCVTAKARPWTFMDPVRVVVPVLPSTEKPIDPVPVPLPGELTESQGAELVAVQLQVGVVLMVNEAEEEDASRLAELADRE